jgi:hypothetical protein
MRKTFFACVVSCVLAAGQQASSETLVFWDFNSGNDATTSTGTTSPVIDTVAGVPAITRLNTNPVGTTGFTSGRTASTISTPLDNSSDPIADSADNSAFGIRDTPTTGGSGTAGIQITLNASGYTDMTLEFDQKTARFAARHWQVLGSIDGVNFSAISPVYTPQAVDRFQSGVSGPVGVSYNQWNNNLSFDLGSAYDNAASVTLQIVAVFAPGTSAYEGNLGNDGAASTYNPTNSVSFDMVTVTGVPEPAVAVLALPLLALRRRR